MNIVIWILQILLAFAAVNHGWLMWSFPKSAQASRMIYMQAIPSGLRHFIAVAEILAAIGLVLPALTGILPWLTPLAAVGIAIIMVSAVIFHILRKEYPNIVLNLILLILATIIAYGRFVIAPL
jgi:hypothetical protein